MGIKFVFKYDESSIQFKQYRMYTLGQLLLIDRDRERDSFIYSFGTVTVLATVFL